MCRKAGVGVGRRVSESESGSREKGAGKRGWELGGRVPESESGSGSWEEGCRKARQGVGVGRKGAGKRGRACGSVGVRPTVNLHGGLLPEVDVPVKDDDVDEGHDHDPAGCDEEGVVEEAREEGHEPIHGPLVAHAESVKRHHPRGAQGQTHGKGPGQVY